MFRSAAAAVALVLLAAPMASAAPSTDTAKMPAGTYVLDKEHASLIARVRHQGFSNYTVRFKTIDASYAWDPKSPQTAEIQATIAASSIDTGVAAHDAKFAEEFLAAKTHPTIKFVSTSIQPVEDGKGKGRIVGDLTLRGVTRPVTLDVTWNGYDSGLTGHRSGFSARTTIKRSDFGSEFLLRPPVAFVGDEVELILELEFTKQ